MEKILLGWILIVSPLLFAASDTLPLKDKQTSGSAEEGSLAHPSRTTFEKEKPKAKDTPDTKLVPYIASVDTFGSPRINELVLRETLGPQLDTWLAAGIKGDPSAAETQARLTEKIRAKFGFPVIDWSVVQYFEPGDLGVHVTLDVVEKEDVARRMPFHPAPKKEFPDPDNLIRTWLEYEAMGLQLVESGQLTPNADRCQAFHCPFGHKQPQLKKFGAIFANGVKKNAAKLLEIQSQDQRVDFRAAATYLLAYMKDGNKVISAMIDRVRDPAPLVRNNALRVLGDIAEYHQDLLIPVQPILQALQFPRVSDRTKSLLVLYNLSLNSQQVREAIVRGAVPSLLAFLDSKQPDHRDMAHAILRKVSGKDYPTSDTRAWAAWFERVSKERAPSNSGGQ